MQNSPLKAIICTNHCWTLFHFRGSLMKALMARGFEVIAAGPRDSHAHLFKTIGVRFEHVPMNLAGLNPFEELHTLFCLYRLYRREKPVLVHHYSHKPVIYGTLVARLAGIRAMIVTVNGLGSTLGESRGAMRLLKPFILLLLRLALRNPVRLTFQNPEMLDFYLARRLIDPGQASIVLGSGIDTGVFSPVAEARGGDAGRPLRFLMFSRMLWAKGVEEYCRAAERVLRRYDGPVRPVFRLIGGATAGNVTGVETEWLANPQTIPGAWLEAEAARGFVDWQPHQDDMLPFIREADVVVLPSYFPEGIPRSLLEAMGCATAIITTDTPGCREVVESGVNGLLVNPQSVDELAEAMSWMVEHPDAVRAMGAASRRMVLDRFSDERVIEQTMETYAAAGVAV